MDFFSFVVITPALLVLALGLAMLASDNKNVHITAILLPLVAGGIMLVMVFWGPVHESDFYKALWVTLFMQACALGTVSLVLMFFHFVVRGIWRYIDKKVPA